MQILDLLIRWLHVNRRCCLDWRKSNTGNGNRTLFQKIRSTGGKNQDTDPHRENNSNRLSGHAS